MICGPGGSKSRLAKAAGAEQSGQMRDEQLHAVVARSTCICTYMYIRICANPPKDLPFFCLFLKQHKYILLLSKRRGTYSGKKNTTFFEGNNTLQRSFPCFKTHLSFIRCSFPSKNAVFLSRNSIPSNYSALI